MLEALESSARIFTGIQSMTGFMQAVSSLATQPKTIMEQPEVLDNLLKGCEMGHHWLESVSSHIHLIKNEVISSSRQDIIEPT